MFENNKKIWDSTRNIKLCPKPPKRQRVQRRVAHVVTGGKANVASLMKQLKAKM
jgi:hypothetical protein